MKAANIRTKAVIRPSFWALFWAAAAAGLSMLCIASAQAGWLVREIQKDGRSEIISVERVEGRGSVRPVVLQSLPAFLSEDRPATETFVETLYNDTALPEGLGISKGLSPPEIVKFPSPSPPQNLRNPEILEHGNGSGQLGLF